MLVLIPAYFVHHQHSVKVMHIKKERFEAKQKWTKKMIIHAQFIHSGGLTKAHRHANYSVIAFA